MLPDKINDAAGQNRFNLDPNISHGPQKPLENETVKIQDNVQLDGPGAEIFTPGKKQALLELKIADLEEQVKVLNQLIRSKDLDKVGLLNTITKQQSQIAGLQVQLEEANKKLSEIRDNDDTIIDIPFV